MEDNQFKIIWNETPAFTGNTILMLLSNKAKAKELQQLIPNAKLSVLYLLPNICALNYNSLPISAYFLTLLSNAVDKEQG